MSKKVIDQAMFNIIDNLTDIGQLTDNVFNNDLADSNLDNELNDKSKKESNQDSLEQSKLTDYQKLTTPNLEDSNSNLSLLDHALTDEEIFKYLSLFSENNFQLVDELDIENTLQPCSSINSNATTVSTQETNEFRESLLNSEVSIHNSADNLTFQQFDEDCNQVFDLNLNESNNYENATANQSIIEKTDQTGNCSSAQTTNGQMIYNLENSTIQANKTNELDHSMNDCQQISSQVNDQINRTTNQINSIEYNQNNQMQSVNYFYSVNNQAMNANNQQISNQFQCMNSNSNISVSSLPNNLQQSIGFGNKNTNSPINNSISSSMANSLIAPNHRCLPNNLSNNLPTNLPANAIDSFSSVNYCDPNNSNTPSTYPNNNSSSTNYLTNNEYFTFTECRDVNCPYTYCSRYNPYYNNFMSSFRNQFRTPNFNDNFLADTSINMNLVDNQIVFNKQSDHAFNSIASTAVAAKQQTTGKTTKRTKRKANKNEFTETSVICNESTDYAFYTLEENLGQSKRKRGRKKKTETTSAVLELS